MIYKSPHLCNISIHCAVQTEVCVCVGGGGGIVGRERKRGGRVAGSEEKDRGRG